MQVPETYQSKLESGRTSTGPSRELIDQELEAILGSRRFARAERSGRFLRFVTQTALVGKSTELKETVIGVSVFGRKPDYDPRADPIVRMEAAKLRTRLKEYYSTEGIADPVVIEVPKGSYVPMFQAGGSLTPGNREARRWILVAVVLALLAMGAGIWKLSRRSPPPSLVVVPFLSLSSSSETEFLADGLADQLTATLSSIEGLKVISRTSAFALKGSKLTTHQIGALLNVAALLEGTVQEDHGRLRITAQLIRTVDDNHLWSQTYERERKDVFVMQDDISRSIANVLRTKLTANPRPAISSAKSLESYNLFLKGRYLCESFKTQDLRTALDYLEQAVAIDPGNAAAYAWIAQSYIRLVWDYGIPPGEAHAKARAAAKKALEMDPEQPEALTALGQLSARAYDWKGAEKLYLQAIRANPNSALAHRTYSSLFLTQHHRMDEAVREIRRAEELDPLSVNVSENVADVLLYAGRYDEAIDAAKKTLELYPNAAYARNTLGRAFLQKGLYPEAIRAVEPESSWRAIAEISSGNREEALRILKKLLSAEPPASANSLAEIYAALDDRDRAFEWLEKGYREGNPGMLLVNIVPELANLRPDPRFRALLKKMNL